MTITSTSPGSSRTPPPAPELRPPKVTTDSRHRAPQVTADYRDQVARTLKVVGASPAAWLFATIWGASALVLVLTGQGFPLDGLLKSVAFLLLSLLTVAITRAAPAASGSPGERPRLLLQVGVILLFVVLTAWRGLAFHGVIGSEAALPLWAPLVEALQRLGDQWFGNGNYVANPLTYVVFPLAVMLLAGARLPELGFARGHRVGRVLLLWCTLPLVAFAYAVLSGQLTLGRLAGRFLSNALNNGFFEEFLFRGALQTRLRQFVAPGWALVLQALVFGAWHLGLGFTDTGHAGWLPALASTLVNQAVIGLAYGVVFERTRNLLAPSIVHVVFNSL